MSKAELKRRASAILNSHKRWDRLTDDENAFMSELLAMHPNAVEKAGPGVQNIFIGRDAYGRNCFWIKRVDGTETDFSYLRCIDGDDSLYSKFSKACRMAIVDQVLDVAQPGEHVHHDAKQFAEIVNEFIKEYEIDLSTIAYIDGDGMTTKIFWDRGLAVNSRSTTGNTLNLYQCQSRITKQSQS
jgi:hypothetical protein